MSAYPEAMGTSPGPTKGLQQLFCVRQRHHSFHPHTLFVPKGDVSRILICFFHVSSWNYKDQVSYEMLTSGHS